MSKTKLNLGDHEEIEMKGKSGAAVLIVTTILMVAALAIFILSAIAFGDGQTAGEIAAFVISGIYLAFIGWIPYCGLKVIKPNEALVLTLFGKYKGTLKKDGFFFVNPFCTAVNPAAKTANQQLTGAMIGTIAASMGTAGASAGSEAMTGTSKKLSLKAMTLNNNKQKINDLDGNPIEGSIVVIWKIVDTAKAVFDVDNYVEFISTQADSTLRDIASLYPYDGSESEDGKSLRRSSAEIAQCLKDELQERVEDAGLEVVEARITHLAYAPEIAAAMLQRQQAAAIIEARQKIVDGAVGMVEMALERITADGICDLDEERKAQMVSNLLVVLCSGKDTQPIVNSDSIY